jgi:uncharacterized HhH-GPD family protein
MPRTTLHLSGNPEADALLARNPLALLIGMVLDQQVRLELAFAAPALLEQRLGQPLEASSIAGMDPERLAAVFSARPALHRYPGSMAKRVHELCRIVVSQYAGDPAGIWRGAADGASLLARVKALPGFGDQKARIFVALLGKQLGVRPAGWDEVSAPFGQPGTHLSVADIRDEASLVEVREQKQARKAAARAGKPPAAATRSADTGPKKGGTPKGGTAGASTSTRARRSGTTKAATRSRAPSAP